MCSFLGIMHSPRIGHNPGAGGGCVPSFLVQVPFWDSYLIFWHFIVIFLFQNARLRIEKKTTLTLIVQYFRSVRKGQTNIFFFSFLGLIHTSNSTGRSNDILCMHKFSCLSSTYTFWFKILFYLPVRPHLQLVFVHE